MDKVEYNVDKYRYEVHDVQLNFWIKLHDYFTAVFSRKNTIKTFCSECGISYPPEYGKHYHLPQDNYNVSHREVNYLGLIRDKIILAFNEKYKSIQRELSSEIDAHKKEVDSESNFLAEEQQTLKNYKDELKKTKDALNSISLESKISNQEARVKNQQAEVAHLSTELDLLGKTLEQNAQSWRQQVEIIDKVIESQLELFVTRATKRIQDKLNFTKFSYTIPPYSESVEKIINGDYNED